MIRPNTKRFALAAAATLTLGGLGVVTAVNAGASDYQPCEGRQTFNHRFSTEISAFGVEVDWCANGDGKVELKYVSCWQPPGGDRCRAREDAYADTIKYYWLEGQQHPHLEVNAWVGPDGSFNDPND